MGLSPNAIYTGDCVNRLAEVDKGSVDLVFADPPFNIGYEYDVYDDRQSPKEYVNWCKTWLNGIHTCLKPNGSFWLAIGDEFAAELKVAAQYDVGFHCRSWVIWYYTFGVNCVRSFSRSHTHLFHFVKDPDDFTFNQDNPAIRVASARQLVYADARANPKGRLPDNTWIYRPQDAPPPYGFLPEHDTWYFARVAGTFKERQGFHGCQMPEQLLGRIIRTSSNPRDVVLDPFGGSGTTLAVAKKLGRQWIGFELSKQYAARIDERLSEVKPGDELNGPADPLASAPATNNGRRNVGVRNGQTIPHADKKTEKGIIAAFKKSCDGYSADHVLCEPELDAAFVKECNQQGVAGTPFVFNRLLLRLRKAGKLPKGNKHGKRLTFAEMDPYSFAGEIALRLLEIDYGLALDDILCSPDAAREFDELASEFAPGFSPFQYRWAALSLRKRAIKSKSLAINQFADWRRKRLPRLQPIENFRRKSTDAPGVYILSGENQQLYVGASHNVQDHLARFAASESWQRLGLSSYRFMSGEEKTLHGLQSALVGRMQPMLNTALLMPTDSGT